MFRKWPRGALPSPSPPLPILITLSARRNHVRGALTVAACSPATFEFLALMPRISAAKGVYLRMKLHARLVEWLQGYSFLTLSVLGP